MKIGALVRTIISRMLLFIIMLLCILPFLIIVCVPERWRYTSRLIALFKAFFYRAVLRSIFVPIRYVGLENVTQVPAIFVANHQSSLDIPLVGILAGISPTVWLARSELLASPLLARILPYLTIIVTIKPVQKAARSLVRLLRVCTDTQANVVLFPEGSRYSDGKIHHFYGGFALLAKQLGWPVIPVKLTNAYKVYPLDAFIIEWYPITVTVGEPLIMMRDESVEAFKNRVQDWFTSQKED